MTTTALGERTEAEIESAFDSARLAALNIAA
jgi:hypothetical protein